MPTIKLDETIDFVFSPRELQLFLEMNRKVQKGNLIVTANGTSLCIFCFAVMDATSTPSEEFKHTENCYSTVSKDLLFQAENAVRDYNSYVRSLPVLYTKEEEKIIESRQSVLLSAAAPVSMVDCEFCMEMFTHSKKAEAIRLLKEHLTQYHKEDLLNKPDLDFDDDFDALVKESDTEEEDKGGKE